MLRHRGNTTCCHHLLLLTCSTVFMLQVSLISLIASDRTLYSMPVGSLTPRPERLSILHPASCSCILHLHPPRVGQHRMLCCVAMDTVFPCLQASAHFIEPPDPQPLQQFYTPANDDQDVDTSRARHQDAASDMDSDIRPACGSGALPVPTGRLYACRCLSRPVSVTIAACASA